MKKKHTNQRKLIAVLLLLVVAEACVLGAVLRKNDGGNEVSVPLGKSLDQQKQETAGITNKNLPSVAQNTVNDGRLELFFDDRFSFTSPVNEIKTISVLSKKTGTDQRDDSVLVVDANDDYKVIASGCGKALVTLDDGEQIEVRVEKAPISLLLIAGQSNGEGRIAENRSIETVSKQYVLNEEGTAYSTYGFSDRDISEEVTWYSETTDDMSIYNYDKFLPKSLTRNDENDMFSRTNCLTDAEDAKGKGGIDSAFAYRWHQLTNEKIWLVNACAHGSSIDSWQSEGGLKDNNFWQAVNLYKGAEKILSDEIKAGHYKLKHKGILWYQGEADREMSADEYYKKLKGTYHDLKEELDGRDIEGMKGEPEFMGLFMIRSTIRNDDPNADFILTGSRMVQYYMAVDKTDERIFLASHIEELWSDNEAVKDYFEYQYGSETTFNKAYPTISENKKMPAVTKDIIGKVHYTQLAYNEMGLDGAENICCYLGYCATDGGPRIVKAVLEDGLTDITGNKIQIPRDQKIPFAVKVYPASLEKDVTITCSDNVSYSPLGLQIYDDKPGRVTITIGDYNAHITINK